MNEPIYERAVDCAPRVRRVLARNPSSMAGPGTNSYIVGDADLVLIDPGPDDAAHREALMGVVGRRLRAIVVTHAHPDHASSARAMSEMTGAPVWGYAARDTYSPDHEVVDGDLVTAGDVALRALFTPGHSSDHVCFLFVPERESEQVLFSGDCILGGPTVSVSAPDGDMAAYFTSVERLIALEDTLARVFPGHGSIVDDPGPKLRTYLEHRRDREAQVVAVLGELAPVKAADIAFAIYGPLDEALTRASAATAWAHLRKLFDEGRAVVADRDDPGALWSPAELAS